MNFCTCTTTYNTSPVTPVCPDCIVCPHIYVLCDEGISPGDTGNIDLAAEIEDLDNFVIRNYVGFSSVTESNNVLTFTVENNLPKRYDAVITYSIEDTEKNQKCIGEIRICVNGTNQIPSNLYINNSPTYE